MSTKIGTVIGRCHDITANGISPVYAPAEINITRFWGGPAGRMIRLTVVGDGISYIQLTENQTKELATILLDCFDDTKYPSD